jgi:hypothetical protein
MTYAQKILLTKKQWNGLVVVYSDPEGHCYNQSFCFQALDEALFATVKSL